MSEVLSTNKIWYNQPKFWQETEDKIIVQSLGKTDFWRITHYDFIRDNGHFYYQEISGNFNLDIKITGDYQTLYDQAGLMCASPQGEGFLTTFEGFKLQMVE